MSVIDLAVVGAGPAGLGAAITARVAGLSVTLVDDQLEPGGQIWRAAGSASAAHARRMGAEYVTGAERVREFLASGTGYLPSHTVWHIEPGEDAVTLHCAGPSGAHRVVARNILLATGAVERPMPIPGWTLPGVLTAGGLQILLKSAKLCPQNAVLAGAGPLLWLLASQMVSAGAPPAAVVECVAPIEYLAAASLLPGALRAPAPLKKGLKLISEVRHAGVTVFRGAHDLEVEGEWQAQALRFTDWRGKRHRIEAETIGLHCGVVPNQQASRLLRLSHRWSGKQHAFHPVRDADMRVAERISMAGDGARIGGAEVAWFEGQLAARLIAGRNVGDLRRKLARAEAARPFLDRLYRPGRDLRAPSDDTILCRCEAVTAGRIRQAVSDGAMGPNQVKFMLRPGMGPCQGRVCGLAVIEVVAETLGQDMQDAGYFRIRPPLKPVPLGVIADVGLLPTVDESGDDPLQRDRSAQTGFAHSGEPK